MEASSAIDPRPWYQSAFDQLYPLLYAHRDDASARQEMGQLLSIFPYSPGARTLDIASGAGRHLRAMLDAGLDAFGIDLSSALLARAISERDLAGRVARADVRALPFAGQFDLAFNLFTSFGYFNSDTANAHALTSMINTLKTGGRFVIDHVNAAHLRRTLVPQDVQAVNDITVTSRRWLDDTHVNKQMLLRFDDGRQEQINERVRVYEPDQMRTMLEAAGLAVDGMFGSFDGQPLDEASTRMICMGVRQ